MEPPKLVTLLPENEVTEEAETPTRSIFSDPQVRKLMVSAVTIVLLKVATAIITKQLEKSVKEFTG